MSDVVIEIDRLWKKYRLGVLGTGTLRHDFNRWLHRTLGKPDPYAKVGQAENAEKLKAEASGPISASQDVSMSAFQSLRMFQHLSVPAFQSLRMFQHLRISAFQHVSI